MQRIINSVELAAEPARRVKLAARGKWLGHPHPGGEELTDERMRSIVEQFGRHYAENRAGLVVDFNHATLLVLKGLCKPDEAIAAGWIRQVALENGEPFGDVEWTANAAAKIRAGEFRYLSPVFEFDVPDRVSGETVPCRLHSVALTNKPFLTELPAVANAADAIASLYDAAPEHTRPSAFVGFAVEWMVKDSQSAEPRGATPSEHAATVADAAAFAELRQRWLANGLTIVIGRLKESDKWDIQAFRFARETWTPEQAQAWLAEHRVAASVEPATPAQEVQNVDVKEIAKLLGLAETATEEECKLLIEGLKTGAAVKNPPLVAANVAELLGVAADADFEVVKAVVEKLKAKPEAEKPADPGFEHVAVANSLGLTGEATLDQVLAAIGKLKGEVLNSDAELLVGKAVADGKIPPADKARWIEEAKKDPKRVEALIANMAPLVRRAASKPPGDDGLPELTEAELEVARQMGLDVKRLRETKRPV